MAKRRSARIKHNIQLCDADIVIAEQKLHAARQRAAIAEGREIEKEEHMETRNAATAAEICASKAALCATGRARTAADTNAVHDRLLQSMRVRFSDSVQRSSLNKFHVCAQTFLFEM
jgi:hypothetical protein